MRTRRSDEQAFTRFVKETEPRLSYALAAAYGPEVGAEATADALASMHGRTGKGSEEWSIRPAICIE
jgi:hypothetical protein